MVTRLIRQSNKGFKSKHSSKGALKAAAKGEHRLQEAARSQLTPPGKIVAPTSAAGGKSSKNVQAARRRLGSMPFPEA